MEDLELYDTVELASGENFKCDYLATIPSGYMFIAIQSNDIAPIAAAFTDKEKTKKITYGSHILEHYTVFCGIQQEEVGRYKIMLRKAFVGEE